MKFNVHATDNQTKMIATMLADNKDDAIKNFTNEWNKDGRLTITKVVGPLGFRKAKEAL